MGMSMYPVAVRCTLQPRKAQPVVKTFPRRVGATLLAVATLSLPGPLLFSAPADAATTATRFAVSANGFGTWIKGGQLPASSRDTAFQSLGCTNRVGVTKSNTFAGVSPGGLTLSGVATTLTTDKVAGTVAVTSSQNVADLKLAADLGTLEVQGVTSVSRAWHNATGFHSAATTTVAAITFAPSGLPAQSIPVPSPGQSIDVPGVGSIALGATSHYANGSGADARADSLIITVTATGSKVTVGHSRVRIDGGITRGVFAGNSSATKASGLSGAVTSGPTPLSIMPCQGTHGQVHVKDLVGVNLGDQVHVGAVHSEQRSSQTSTKASGYELGRVAGVTLGNGQLVIKTIIGKATVTRTDAGITRSISGTKVGSVTLNGQTLTFPPTGVLEIPGIAKLERAVVTKLNNGVSVVGLRVTPLDGSGAVLNLGNARLTIRPSGL
jgi:hypothetical protein